MGVAVNIKIGTKFQNFTKGQGSLVTVPGEKTKTAHNLNGLYTTLYIIQLYYQLLNFLSL